MSFNQSEHIGRPAPGVKKAKGILVLSARITGNITSQGIASSLVRANDDEPIIVYENGSDLTIKTEWNLSYKATDDAVLDFEMFEFGGVPYIDERGTASNPGGCGDAGTDTIKLAGNNISQFIDAKDITMTLNNGGSVGRTICSFSHFVTVSIAFSSGGFLELRPGNAQAFFDILSFEET